MSRIAESTGNSDTVSRVLGTFRAGELVLVHDFDDREGETNLIYPAGVVGSADVARMRNDTGGLACVALPNNVSESLGLLFMNDMLDHPAVSSRGLAYDSWSSSSFTVNHRGSFTGTTDCDRATIVSRLTSIVEAVHVDEYDADDFDDEFHAPGRVHLLRGTPDPLLDHQGHTEFGFALADETGISSTVVAYEMLDDGTDAALPKDAARDYTDRHGFAFADGDSLIDELV